MMFLTFLGLSAKAFCSDVSNHRFDLHPVNNINKSYCITNSQSSNLLLQYNNFLRFFEIVQMVRADNLKLPVSQYG